MQTTNRATPTARKPLLRKRELATANKINNMAFRRFDKNSVGRKTTSARRRARHTNTAEKNNVLPGRYRIPNQQWIEKGKCPAKNNNYFLSKKPVCPTSHKPATACQSNRMHKRNNGGTAHLAKPQNLTDSDGNKVQKNIKSRMVIVKAIVTKPIRFERDTPDHFQNVSAISRKTTWK